MVILEEATFEKFGYYSADLSHKSNKRLLVACDKCGKIRYIRKQSYRALCLNCSCKGRHHSEETRKKLSESHKGKNNINFGAPLSKDHKRKLSKANKGKKGNMCGKHHSAESRRRISETKRGKNHPMFGKHHSEETRRKIGDGQKGEKGNMFGKHPSEETRKKMSKAHSGENNSNWKGGISYEPYCHKFNFIFKEYIRNKFGRVCFLCGKSEGENGKKLSVHHVNYDKLCGCAETEEDRRADDIGCQFVPLCISCNSKVNKDRDIWELYFKKKLRNTLNGWFI